MMICDCTIHRLPPRRIEWCPAGVRDEVGLGLTDQGRLFRHQRVLRHNRTTSILMIFPSASRCARLRRDSIVDSPRAIAAVDVQCDSSHLACAICQRTWLSFIHSFGGIGFSLDLVSMLLCRCLCCVHLRDGSAAALAALSGDAQHRFRAGSRHDGGVKREDSSILSDL